MRPHINEYSLIDMLGMKPLALLDEDKNATNAKGNRANRKPDDETDGDITDYEAENTTTCRTSRPIDVAALQTHELQRSLKTLEDRVLTGGVADGTHRSEPD